VILCSGCFDGLHAGHVAYLRLAERLTEPDERLIVAVACDAYIERHKGRTPIWRYIERADTVSELRCVDHVWMHGATGAAGVIRRLRPRLFVKGDDWRILGLPDDVLRACLEVGCSPAFVKTPITSHTSDALPPHQ